MLTTPLVSEIIEFSDFIIKMKVSFKAKVALLVKGEILYNLFKISSHLSNKNSIKIDIFFGSVPPQRLQWILIIRRLIIMGA